MNLTDPTFQDDAKARTWLEAQIWPNGPECPHCGNADASKIKALEGKSHRAGLFKCNECREQFTVTVGTVMERSKIPLRKWVMAMFVMAAAKKGISAHQMHRMMDIPYKTAWFLMHRIREAMKDGRLVPIGGTGKVVEADETYFGSKEVITKRTKRGKSAHSSKRAVVALIERGGEVRSFHVPAPGQFIVQQIIKGNVANKTRLHTDESRIYNGINAHYSHETVKHTAGEYARGDVTTNSVEGYFSVFKRGMRGTYQQVGEKHLHRYLTEFDFRYNRRTALGVDDTQRASALAKGALGKRLMYKVVIQKI